MEKAVLSQTAVFTKLVRDYMAPTPLLVSAADTCSEVVARIREHKANSALITDEQSCPLGIITEQDVCRRIAFLREPDIPVSEVMTTPVESVQADSYLYHAIAVMRRLKLRHMPVIDHNNHSVGELQIADALSVAAAQMVDQIDRLSHPESVDGMRQTKVAQIDVALQLQRDKVPAPEIQTLVTNINNDLYRRIVGLCRAQMVADGWGQPPVEFDVIVMGSGGRGESFLFPDQDNGFILADYPDDQHDKIDRWFIELAERMTRALDETGFTYCNGYVMATNPLWRKTISQWCEQISQWVGRGSGMVLRLADIFFDFIPVYGAGQLTDRLRQHVTQTAREPFFLREMFKFDQEHEVALGLFNYLLKDKTPGVNQGKINLKLTGTLPLVGAVRIGALAHGIAATSTLKRIAALAGQGKLSTDEQDYLSGAFLHITNLLLRQQLRDHEHGRPVGNHVDPADMSKRERDMLKDGFNAIKTYRKNLRLELTGDIF